jgi:hypothetical protein
VEGDTVMGYRKKKDANQKDLEQAVKELGGAIVDTTGDPDIGFDMLVVFRGVVYIVEVKDGAKPPSARQLTEGEIKRKRQVEQAGGRYSVVTSRAELYHLIGAY